MVNLQERIAQHIQQHGETVGVIGIDPEQPPTLHVYVPNSVLDHYQRESGDVDLSSDLAIGRIWRDSVEPFIYDFGILVVDDFGAKHSVDRCPDAFERSGWTQLRSLRRHPTGAVLSVSAEYTGA